MLESSVSIKDKEVIYLKRAMESVYSRFRSREENRESESDAQMMATRALDGLAERDKQIESLQQAVELLKEELAVKPKFITEQDYKQKVAPPPPPPVKLVSLIGDSATLYVIILLFLPNRCL